jgi:hypothetical protein
MDSLGLDFAEFNREVVKKDRYHKNGQGKEFAVKRRGGISESGEFPENVCAEGPEKLKNADEKEKGVYLVLFSGEKEKRNQQYENAAGQ